jgi:hypothetical protein
MVTTTFRDIRGNWASSLMRTVIALIAVALMASVAVAEPEQLPVNTALKKDLNKINVMLMAGRFDSADNQALFDKFYQDYFLARWTEVKTIANLPAYRKELRNSHLGKKSSGGGAQVHDHLNELVLDFMNKLANGPYHPAVQVNAMQMIGDLNSVESPPTPLPEALGVLIAAVENTKLPEAVRVAAMVGIERHVASQIRDEDVRKTLTNALLKVATTDPPQDDADAAREWILVQAVETLGRLGSVGENSAVFNALAKTLANSRLSLYTRGVAAGSLGLLNYSDAAGINPVDAAAQLGQFLMDACDEELKLAKETSQPISRRRIKQRICAALSALIGGEDAARKGIVSLAREPGQQAFLVELRKTIESLNDFIDDKKHESDDLQAPVTKLRTELDAWLKKKPK